MSDEVCVEGEDIIVLSSDNESCGGSGSSNDICSDNESCGGSGSSNDIYSDNGSESSDSELDQLVVNVCCLNCVYVCVIG